MRAHAFIVFSTSLLCAASGSDCTTPLGTPCMVVQSVHEQRSVLSRGINYHHSRSYQKTAYASDGSVGHEVTFEKIPLFGNSEIVARTAQLYLKPSDRVVRIFHTNRQFSRREPIIWHDRPYRRAKADDATCASGILHSGTDFQTTGEHTILGTKTIRWYRPLEYGGYEEQFLAPALDCLALRAVRIHKNILRIPVITDHMEVTSVQFGEPDRGLFQVPADYREIPDASAERLKRLVGVNQRRVSAPDR